MKNHIKGAFVGRISGCLLGKPVEGFRRKHINAILEDTNNMPLHRFMEKKEFGEDLKKYLEEEKTDYDVRCFADCLEGSAPIDDDTNYTVMTLKMVKKHLNQLTSQDVLNTWLSDMPIAATFTAEHVTYRNAVMGLDATETANYFNPYREWIGAQIRGDFYGYAHLGNPEKAAEMAYLDACISHTKNGIYGEMFIAAMIAATPLMDIKKVIYAGLNEIPTQSRLHEAVQLMMKRYDEKKTYKEVIDEIHTLYDEYSLHGWCHTISNAMIVVMALLFGEGDVGMSMCMAVEAAFDTDCNGATVGSILGMMYGFDKIDARFYQCYNLKLNTSIMEYNYVTVDQLVDETMDVIKRMKA